MSFYCGVDIGGTGVKLALINEEERILRTDSFSTSSGLGPDFFVDALSKAIVRLTKESKASCQLTAIGIGCTGPIDTDSGLILNLYTLPGLEGMNILDEIQSRLQLPAYLENDANTAHLGEIALYDKGIVPGNTALMTFGTGVGCSIRIDKKIFRTIGGIHPEIGHTSAGVNSDITCYCGKNNCMENVLSGTAINRDAQRLFNQTPEKVLDNPDNTEKKTFREHLIAALTNSITTIVGIFNSEQVFIAGGMKNLFAKYLIPETQQRLDKLLPVFGGTKIILTEGNLYSGSLGAALLAKIRYQEIHDAPLS